jgi:hypothetical protein
VIEEAAEDVEAQALPDAAQPRVVGEQFVQVVQPRYRRCARLRLAISMSWRSRRNPEERMSWSLKKTTGSMLGQPRSP